MQDGGQRCIKSDSDAGLVSTFRARVELADLDDLCTGIFVFYYTLADVMAGKFNKKTNALAVVCNTCNLVNTDFCLYTHGVLWL